MSEPSNRTTPRRTWLTMHEASDLIGVSQATLRRWAEAGDIEAFVTPGGHRRFDLSAVNRLLPGTARRRRSLRELGETPERIVRQYRRELAGAASSAWLPPFGERERAAFREPGRRILGGVLAFLDAPTPAAADVELERATAGAAECGRLAAAGGFGVIETTTAFVRFRAPFLEEMATTARRHRVEPSDAISLIIAAASVFDRLLLAVLQGHGESRETAAPPSQAERQMARAAP